MQQQPNFHIPFRLISGFKGLIKCEYKSCMCSWPPLHNYYKLDIYTALAGMTGYGQSTDGKPTNYNHSTRQFLVHPLVSSSLIYHFIFCYGCCFINLLIHMIFPVPYVAYKQGLLTNFKHQSCQQGNGTVKPSGTELHSYPWFLSPLVPCHTLYRIRLSIP